MPKYRIIEKKYVDKGLVYIVQRNNEDYDRDYNPRYVITPSGREYYVRDPVFIDIEQFNSLGLARLYKRDLELDDEGVVVE